MNYLEGSTVTLRATFRNIAGELVTPSSVVLTIEDPDGDITTPAPSNPTVGVFEHLLTLDEVGWWDFRWEGDTPEGMVVCEGKVCATASALVMST